MPDLPVGLGDPRQAEWSPPEMSMSPSLVPVNVTFYRKRASADVTELRIDPLQPLHVQPWREKEHTTVLGDGQWEDQEFWGECSLGLL